MGIVLWVVEEGKRVVGLSLELRKIGEGKKVYVLH
jgi:hypothetical protein